MAFEYDPEQVENFIFMQFSSFENIHNAVEFGLFPVVCSGF